MVQGKRRKTHPKDLLFVLPGKKNSVRVGIILRSFYETSGLVPQMQNRDGSPAKIFFCATRTWDGNRNDTGKCWSSVHLGPGMHLAHEKVPDQMTTQIYFCPARLGKRWRDHLSQRRQFQSILNNYLELHLILSSPFRKAVNSLPTELEVPPSAASHLIWFRGGLRKRASSNGTGEPLLVCPGLNLITSVTTTTTTTTKENDTIDGWPLLVGGRRPKWWWLWSSLIGVEETPKERGAITN